MTALFLLDVFAKCFPASLRQKRKARCHYDKVPRMYKRLVFWLDAVAAFPFFMLAPHRDTEFAPLVNGFKMPRAAQVLKSLRSLKLVGLLLANKTRLNRVVGSKSSTKRLALMLVLSGMTVDLLLSLSYALPVALIAKLCVGESQFQEKDALKIYQSALRFVFGASTWKSAESPAP